MTDSGSEIAELKRLVGELTKEVKTLKAKVRRQDRRIDELQAENAQLREQLGDAQTAAARQAAPFRRRETQKKEDDEKKPPGRQGGHRGHCRPVPGQVDEEIEVPLDRCPDCDGPIHEIRCVEQFIEEIPPLRPRVTRLVTYTARCERCGEVCSTHPLQMSRGRGAAKVQLGPRALSLAAWLNKHLGLTMRKTCRVLKDLVGLRLTAGGLSQALDRLADRLVEPYEALVSDIRGSPATYADETSWWVDGPGSWLWTFTTPTETVYRVDASRGSGVVDEVLGDDYAGVLVSDCLNTYDPSDCRKHKCIVHHLRAIRQARDLPGQNDPSYLDEWERLFKAVTTLHKVAVDEAFSPGQWADLYARFQAWADRLLAMPRSQTGDAKVQNRLKKQRRHLLTCLQDPNVEPTNNRAERALRPAVIARKLSCGNKTDRGRRTFQTLASLAQTAHQRGQNFLDFIRPHITLQNQPG